MEDLQLKKRFIVRKETFGAKFFFLISGPSQGEEEEEMTERKETEVFVKAEEEEAQDTPSKTWCRCLGKMRCRMTRYPTHSTLGVVP